LAIHFLYITYKFKKIVSCLLVDRYHASIKIRGNISTDVPCIFHRILVFNTPHQHSIACVWASVVWWKTFFEWFTVLWSEPLFFKQEYALHPSDIIIETGYISFSMIGIKVSLLRFSTTKNFRSKLSPILLNNPNTQGPTSLRP